MLGKLGGIIAVECLGDRKSSENKSSSFSLKV